MGEYTKDLDWKNHNPFYLNLNKDLDKLKEISLLIKDLRFLQQYYDYLDNFIVHYAPYMDNDYTELDVVRKIIYSTDFNRTIVKKELKTEREVKSYNKILDCITKLKSIHSQISRDVYDNNLLPRVTKKRKTSPGQAVKNVKY